MEEEADQLGQRTSAYASSYSSPINSNRISSEVASTSSSSSQVREEEGEEEYDQHQQPGLEQLPIGISYQVNHAEMDDDEPSMVIRDDTWSCIIVVLTFWFFVSMTLILGVYGSVNSRLGPHCSFLLQPNPILVQYIKVEEVDESKPGLMLYGFNEPPPLDVASTWSETHNASIQSYSHKDWIYFLNKGSQLSISFSVNSPNSASVYLVIAQGNEGLSQWLEDPTYPNTTLSWNFIHGSGTIQQDIMTSSSYYVAVGNLNLDDIEVQLNLTVRALLYNTTEAYYKCSLSQGLCSLQVPFPSGNAAVLTSPGPAQGTSSDEWHVKLSYGPRWITYIVGIGVMTVLMLLAFNFLNKFQCTRDDGTRVQFGEMGSERTPLLLQKDDDLSSWGSSYDSVSHDEEDPEDWLAVGSHEGKPLKNGENYNLRRLCAICYDAPRDCFFLPCGHCVACFTCGTRIAEAAGTCPICRRNMKKVRRIYTV
ncbi:hypothetical protein L1049_008759 [Liquidambar formosana]|uniref:RING-type domain-containing protein n=1 Tax=Liquidambar formosana TaxID=63359 RepID=A0AAP0X8G7_LIQFO